MKKYIFVAIFLFQLPHVVIAQAPPFQISIQPMDFPALNGIQSFSFGQADGKWLIIGGRIDGLHMRQPFGAFRPAGKNTQLTVIDPVKLQQWHAPLSGLSSNLQDQLSATNMQFHQEGDMLYLIGGYGFSDSLRKFTTYEKLTAVDVPEIIDAIINGKSISSSFRQMTDTGFAVTGGHLKKINDNYYLAGGQKFVGRYNPMGPDHGPGFFQQYTDQVRKFNIVDNGTALGISNYEVVTDTPAFHRRDYNVIPQILPNGKEGLTLFSGVFQPTADIPFLNSVTMDGEKYAIDNRFAQYYNHYHSAVLPVYSSKKNEMHNVFFGGIAQYYDSAGVLIQNDEVPFVKTIARVTRNSKGHLAEYKLPVEMPALLGAGSEFIPLASVPQFKNEVIKLDELPADTTLVGHIYGGIASSQPNVFFINTGEESVASSKLFKVFIIKTAASVPDRLNEQSNNGLQLQVFPDADEDNFLINFTVPENSTVELQISNAKGKIIKKEILKGMKPGKHSILKSIRSINPGDSFSVTLKTALAISSQKINLEQ